MHCPACGTANPATANYCLNCGQMLAYGVVCRECYLMLPGNARFCYRCRTPVLTSAGMTTGEPVQPVAAVPAPPPAADAPTIPTQPAAQSAPASPANSAAAQPAVNGAAAAVGLPEAAPLPAMLGSLRRYLPDTLYEPMERHPLERHLTAARDHLYKLLLTTRTYLPQPVFEQPQPPGEPSGGMYQGVFLFVDVSGFTPLSEQLRQYGNAGAERITEIINDLFDELVGVLFDHGGTLLKFGGDALLGLFTADDDDTMAQGALQAAQAAVAMQATMRRFAEIDAAGAQYTLRIKCGISAGRYFAAHIGTENNMAFITTGHTVNQAEEAEGHAEPGEIVMTAATADLLDARVTVEPHDEAFFYVRAAEPIAHKIEQTAAVLLPDGPVQAQMTYLVARLDRLTSYLPDELIARIVTNPEDTRIAPDHRPVTIIFANYVGLSELVADLGDTEPDVITYQLNRYFVHMAEIVERYEGTLARMDQYSVGDRLVIFFGAPRAHEDDPVRAVYTALEMQQATRDHFSALKTRQGVYRFRQRVGINTGYLFAGNVGAPELRQEYTLMGDDINTAARLMSRAEWGSIYITQRTQRRVADFFEMNDLGELPFKGKRILIHTYEVLNYRERSMRETDVTPLIGREGAARQLQAAGQSFLKGRGQILSIIGEGGTGKSRLLRTLQDWMQQQDNGQAIRWVEVQALSFSEQIGYWLAERMITSLSSLGPGASKDEQLFQLWEDCRNLLDGDIANEVAPFLAYMMDLDVSSEAVAWIADLDPQVRQKQTMWAARELLAARAKVQPLVIVLDELHWADESSLALLEDMLEVTLRAPLLFIFVFRPAREKGVWRLRNRAESHYHARYTEIELAPLDETQSRQLLAELLPGATFTETAIRDILDKAAGNPFYLQEVVRSLINSGAVEQVADDQWRVTAQLDHITIPDTLQGAIIARIDSLAAESRQTLQTAAVIGRRFQTEVLQIISEARDQITPALAQLERDEMILPDHEPLEQAYNFLDALVYEVAYENLLTQRRQVLHRKIGLALEQILGDEADQRCELLAYHFRRSDDPARAMKYLELAGIKSQAEFANETALAEFAAVLDLLDQTGDEAATWEKRFEILERCQQIHALLGQQEKRAANLHDMMQLAESHSDQWRRARVLNALSDMYQWTGRYTDAEEHARAALAILTELGDTRGQAQAQKQLGVLEYVRGNYEQAAILLKESSALWREVNNTADEALTTMYLGMIDYVEGNYDSAIERHEYALSLARERQDMFQEGIHLTNAARVYLHIGDYQRAREQFERGLTLKQRTGDRVGQGFNLLNLGLIHMYLEELDDAETLIQQSLTLRQEINDQRGVSLSLNGLGLLNLKRGGDGQDRALAANDEVGLAASRAALERAAAYFRDSYEKSRDLGIEGEVILNRSYLGQALNRLGQFDEARRVSDEAIAWISRGDVAVQQEQRVYFNHFLLLKRQADPAAAEYLQQAYDELMVRAGQITDPARKQMFLHSVKANEAILNAVESGQWHIERRDPAVS